MIPPDRSARHDRTTAASLGRAPIRAGARIDIAAPADDVWQVLLDVASWEEWYTGVTNVVGDSPLRPGSRFSFKAGPAQIDAKVIEVVADQRLRFSGSSLGTKSTYEFLVSDMGDTTHVTAAQTMSGLAALPMKLVLQGVADKAVVRWLDALRAKTEA